MAITLQEKFCYVGRDAAISVSLLTSSGAARTIEAGETVRVKIGRGQAGETPLLDLDSTEETAAGSTVTATGSTATITLAAGDTADWVPGPLVVEVGVVSVASLYEMSNRFVLQVLTGMGGRSGLEQSSSS